MDPALDIPNRLLQVTDLGFVGFSAGALDVLERVSELEPKLPNWDDVNGGISTEVSIMTWFDGRVVYDPSSLCCCQCCILARAIAA